MKNKINNFKDVPLILAFIIAVFSGVGALYFSITLVPVFIEVTKMINQGVPIRVKGWLVIFLLISYGMLAYFYTIVFQLAHRRIIDALFSGK